ncbi:alpha/beta fold hydrolase [Aspergillus clavatus NRRL 1]|uniref:Alpha/beta fold family hydrolase, putative n=1 Tax=Aspergillus clavatus (strain ATCC 1007 / CBS 513.65 / DSM 816 / NCTC 3887 / NRRL 1 / QM 1276 / 107) TaxID=344612 RepID=A1C4N1_ASPCL|nr:alpha/beta fold family hydrolase, putative [Aspergillus clavatus NRRL 1]EAW15371.1 alpha/beta fold family hydrolase, putative [Aspergillus clavatus NRRL 1]
MHFPLSFFLPYVAMASWANALPDFNQPLASYKWPTQFVRSDQANIQVLVEGAGPTVVLLPSYGRDGGEDYNYFTSKLVSAGYLVLRPQPRGTFESTGPMSNVSLADLAADVAATIDALGSGKAIVIGHAFGTFVAKVSSVLYPEKIPAIIVAAPGGIDLPTDVAQLPFVAGNTSLPLSERLEALQSAFFAPGHDAHVWLDGWYPDVLAMEHDSVKAYGSLTQHWAGGNNTQVLELIPAEDPFQPRSQWNVTSTLYPERATSVVIADAAHALFPEQPRAVVEAVLPWLKQQSSKL